MPSIVVTNHTYGKKRGVVESANLDLKEFAELLQYELAIDNLKLETIIDAVKYMERRGFVIYKRKMN